MKRKLKSDSTMKTITYGLFIYVCLTTFYGIFAASPPSIGKIEAPPAQTPLECDLRSIIKKSKYVKDCLNTMTNVSLPELQLEARGQYLCTGIFEIANKICDLNHASINETSFNVSIEKLRSRVGNNITELCSQMKTSISKTAKNSINNSEAPSNINKLNDNLIPRCADYCSLTHDTPVHPLCFVLYMVNEVLLGLKKSEIPGPNSPQPDQISVSKTSSSSLPTSVEQQATKTLSTIINDPELMRSPEIPNSSQEGEEPKPKPDPKLNAPKSGSKSPDLPQIQPSVHNSASDKSETQPTEKDTQQKEIVKDASRPALNAAQQGVSGKTSNPSEEKPLVTETPHVVPEQTGPGKILPGVSDTGIKSGGDQPGEDLHHDEPEDTDDDGSEMELPEDSGPLPPDVKHKGDAAKPEHGDGKEPDENLEEPKTGQGSVYPQDHPLVNSGGPPDPPQHFFAYFMAISFICIICYIGYHKKHKIMGIIFEGRKSRGGRGRRRPNTAGYRKLDCNLEEAVTSQCNSNVTHVIY